MLRSIVIAIALSLALVVPASHAETNTLWCSGDIHAENSSGQKRSGKVSTTVEFDEENNYFAIKDTTNLERGATYPYTELKFFKSSISWQTGVDKLIGNGTFFGSINRMTGEMTTHYFGKVHVLPEIVTIDGSLVCEKQTRNRF